MSLEEVLNDPTRKMGHAFVLAMMLENPELVEKCIEYQRSLSR
jgi:hypothetical protein